MKCLSQPSRFFRRALPLGLPSPQSPALTPQHPQAKLKLVNNIRKSLGSSDRQTEGGRISPFDGNGATEEPATNSFTDITRENKWFLLDVVEGLPAARSNHAAVSSGGNVYVVGGESVDGPVGDIQVFSIEQFLWRELYPRATEAVKNTSSELSGPLQNAPRSTRGPTLLEPFAGVWKGQLIVVGYFPSAPDDAPITVHTFNPTHGTWTALNPKGEVPEARIGYRIVQVKSILVMFGGEDTNGRIVDDVFVLNLENMTWMLHQTTGMKPAPRRYHAMACYDGRYIWIYGGKSYATYYNDLYCLDLKQLVWTKVKPKGAIPTVSRTGHVGIIRGDSFYIVGGENRGDEMVDTLAFDIRNRSWSVVTRVHAMSPLAHNGLSVLKVNYGGRQYLVAFGGHGILLSGQIYALLLPSTDQSSEPNSLSSPESLRLNSISKCSTLPQDKDSPTGPFQFHGAASLSSSSCESDGTVASAESGPELAVVESPKLSRKERPRPKTLSGNLNFDATTISGEPYQPSRLSNSSRHVSSPLSEGIAHCEEDFVTIEKNSRIGRSDTNWQLKDGLWSLKVLETKENSRLHCDSPITDTNKMGEKNYPRTPVKKIRGDTDAISEQLRVVVKAIKELQEEQRSNQAKDEDLNVALQTLKELQEEIKELRRNREDQERNMQKKLMTVELMIDKRGRSPGRRISTPSIPKIEHSNEVGRDNRAAKSRQDEVTPKRTVAKEAKMTLQNAFATEALQAVPATQWATVAA